MVVSRGACDRDAFKREGFRYRDRILALFYFTFIHAFFRELGSLTERVF